jgi:hypothetical protein
MPVIPAFERLSQEDHGFKAHLDYPCQKKKIVSKCLPLKLLKCKHLSERVVIFFFFFSGDTSV